MRRYLLFLFLLITFIPNLSNAQTEEKILEEISLSASDPDVFTEDLTAQLELLKPLQKNPLNLNTISEEELQQIFFLSANQINQFFLHRQKSGPFLSVNELQVIPGFTPEVIIQMLPYITVKPSNTLKLSDLRKKSLDNSAWSMFTYSRTLQPAKGYQITDPERSKYLGSPDRLLARFRWSHQDKLLFTLNMKKDPGEPFFAAKQRYGFDYYAGSIYYRNIKQANHLILGDFHVQLGQGLMVWTGPQFGNRNAIAPILQQPIGIRPHTGMTESRFFRGIAASFRKKNFQFIPFLSYKKETAILNHLPDLGWVVTSINYSGLHRTPSEQRNRRTTGIFNAGTSMHWSNLNWKLGLGYLYHQLQYPLQPRPTYYNQYRFRGTTLHQFNAHYQYSFYNLLLYGETAHSIGSGWANYHGLSAGLGRKFSINIRYRHYQPNYQQFFAQSFQAQSNLGNEQGAYLSLAYHPFRKFDWIGSFDYVQFQKPRYRVRLPSEGWLFQSQMSYNWYKKGYLRLRYQYKWFQENFPAESKLQNSIANVLRHQVRLNFQYKLTDNWMLNNQVEGRHFAKDGAYAKKGLLALQDVIWKNPGNPFSANLRLAWFNVDSYDARIYTYERDVLYAFSFPSFFRNGIRAYANLKCRIGKSLEFCGKAAHTHYFGIDEMGSGLDLIAGNQRTDIRVQIRYSWN